LKGEGLTFSSLFYTTFLIALQRFARDSSRLDT
jgi:hypothetical protein